MKTYEKVTDKIFRKVEAQSIQLNIEALKNQKALLMEKVAEIDDDLAEAKKLGVE